MAGHEGRQPAVEGGRGFVHQVKVTGDDEGRLLRLAEEQGVTVARLLVETTLARAGDSPAARRAVFAELLRLRRDVHGLATNVNQLAHQANAEGRFPAEADRIGALIESALDAIEQTMRELQA